MAYKLIALDERGLFIERELINFEDSYLTDMDGFPIVLSKSGNKVCLKNFSILKNKLVVNNLEELSSFELVKESNLREILAKAKHINAIDFIVEGEI